MNISLAFIRILFLILSIFFMTVYMVAIPVGTPLTSGFIGAGIGLLFGLILIGFDMLFRRYNLRAFNIAIIGIFIGYLMGQALVITFDAILNISKESFILPQISVELIEIGLFLFGIYLGTIMTLRASDELYISIPFVKFSPEAQKKRDLIIDSSVLSDTRIIDMAASGIVDYYLILPRFLIKELYTQAEAGDEKAKRGLDTIKKLEDLPHLGLRYNDTDFPDVKESQSKLIRLARLLDANLLSADISKVQISSLEGVNVINIHTLSNALKPLMHSGEVISVKVQRYGKEPNQGVGYLDDGTMVVINGGGDYIGEIIEATVLSVKHTTSGRMIFCNAPDYEE